MQSPRGGFFYTPALEFRSFIYSQSSTKPVNFAKTGPVDAEIIGLAEITKIYKHKQYMSPPRLPFAQSGCAKGVQVTLTQTLIL